MGYAPPTDYPDPSEQASVEATASFEPSPSGSSLCGFTIPPVFSFGLTLYVPGFPPALPSFPFAFSLSLNCDLSNPIDADFSFGGGRVSTGPNPDEDAEFGSS
jgi:hypothetical protein